MKRSPLKRKSWLKRGKPLAKVNRKRKEKRHVEAFGPQAALCRETECCVCKNILIRRVAPLSEPHHHPPRSRGGTDRDTVPLCTFHHRQSHDMGQDSFWAAYKTDWRAVRDEMRMRVAA